MGKSIGAKLTSDILELFSMFMDKNGDKLIENARKKGESFSPAPAIPRTRHEDNENGRIFYANEEAKSGITVFYIHGGAYFMDFTKAHWRLLEILIREADAQVIAPGYRMVPFATWREAFDLIVPLYSAYCEAHPDQKIILMGDSAGGGLSLALAEHFKAEGIRLPDELVLLSPWVDVSMENEKILDYQDVDPFLTVTPLLQCGALWKVDLDVHDWHVSPIYGDMKGLRNVTVFAGTDGILYPDITKCYGLLDTDPSNELIIGEGMNHVYPLFTIPEAKPAVKKILEVVKRR